MLNSSHRYRIDWQAGNFLFYVDNNTVAAATISFNITTAMVIQASCYSATGPALDLYYLYASPYAASGSFVSRIFDAGSAVTWTTASWLVDTTSTSSIRLLQRQGNSPTIDNSWTSFTPIVQNGGLVGGVSRYFQYQADLKTTNTSTTPVLKQFNVCSINNLPPVVPSICLNDQVKSDFSAGTLGAGIYLSALQNGAVILKPDLAEEFPGTVLSTSWQSGTWNPGGKTTVANGLVSINGTHIYSIKKYVQGSSIDFIATFRADTYQNIGFSMDSLFNAPWVSFGTSGTGNGVYALASNGSSVFISSALLGTAHRYRIDWKSGNFSFYVDNNPVAAATISFNISSTMVIQASCYSATGPALDLNYLYTGPYAASATFFSQILDAGAPVNWLNASWLADTTNTNSVRLFQRQGNTALVDSSWTAFNPIVKTGAAVGGVSRYFQYRADLATTNLSSTPALNQFSICAINKTPAVIVPTTCLTDMVQKDFALGTPDNATYLSTLQNGNVILKPGLNEEFAGTTLTPSWKSATWNTGGTTIVNAGQVSVNGTHIYSTRSFVVGSSVDFLATFRADSYQNVGFTADSSFNAPWAAFGTSGSGDGVYALSSDGTAILISASLLNGVHRYRIVWRAGSFLFYVDNNQVPVATIPLNVTSTMLVHASCYSATGPALSVGALYASPYAAAGSFVSKVFDAGAIVSWATASWLTDTTATSSIRLFQRQGNTPIVDNSWTSFSAIIKSGNSVSGTSRYFQYRADLKTTNLSSTPVLKQFSICSIVPTFGTKQGIITDSLVVVKKQGLILSDLFKGFTAAKVNCQVHLDWKFDNNGFVSKFIVEYSDDGVFFTPIGEKSINEFKTYLFDFSLNQHKSSPLIYVKLKAIKVDGDVQYSKTISIPGICVKNGVAGIYIYPNPVTNTNVVTIAAEKGLFNGSYQIIVVDYTGRSLRQRIVSAQQAYNFKIDLGNLTSGKYLLKIQGNQGALLGVLPFIKL